VPVFVGSDHAAVAAKRAVIAALAPFNVEIIDLGTDSDESVDYPDYAVAVADAVATHPGARGVLLCGTGIGMSIAANKVDGIRAALVGDVAGATMSRMHNDANVLVLGGRVTDSSQVADIVQAWMNADYEGGRHQRRLDKITAIETRSTGARPNLGGEKSK
jgi:ribose 5-phosphate isomerase B